LVHRGSGHHAYLSDLIGNLRRKGGFLKAGCCMSWGSAITGVIPLVEKVLMVKKQAQLRQQFLDWRRYPTSGA